MKYLIFSIYALFVLNFLAGCQQSFDSAPAAIEFVEFPIQYPEWMEDDSQDSIPQPSSCIEIIRVDFEPLPFGNLVQTVPYHLEKEPIQDAFISVKMQTQQIPWIIYFQSHEVKFAHQSFVAFDDYGGDLDRYLSIDQSICEVHLWDTIQAHDYLHTYEQLIVEIEIECYME